MKYRFIFYIIALALGCIYCWTLFQPRASEFSPWAVDAAKLGNATQSLRDYAKSHSGQFPQSTMPSVTEGLNVKAICIISTLPQSQPPIYGNFPELAQPYAFLYFPISSQLGSKDKIITASLVPYYYLNGKQIRNVEFYDGGGESMNESEFEVFLNKQAADK